MNDTPLQMRRYRSPHDPRVVIAEIAGEVDLHGSMELLEFLTGLLDQADARVLVDLDYVEFVDGSGLDALMGVLRRTQRDGGLLAVCCSQESVLQHFRSTGLTRYFSIHGSKAEGAEFLTTN